MDRGEFGYHREQRRPMKSKAVESEVRRRLRLLDTVDRGESVIDACRKLGYTRRVYYATRDVFDEGGPGALRRTVARALVRGNEYDDKIVAVSRQHGDWGRERVAAFLTEQGMPVSASTVRRVWIRHGIIEGEALRPKKKAKRKANGVARKKAPARRRAS